MRIIKIVSLSTLATVLCLIGVPAHGPDGLAVANQGTSSTVEATPMLARAITTYSEDRALTNSCIEDGFSKSECLCVTKVMKYEMTLIDYQAAVGGYVSRGDRPALATSSERLTSQALSDLIEDPSFEYRCGEAHRYFEANRTG